MITAAKAARADGPRYVLALPRPRNRLQCKTQGLCRRVQRTRQAGADLMWALVNTKEFCQPFDDAGRS